VIERRRWPEAGKVGRLADDVPPVAHVANGSQHISPEAWEQGPIQQRNPRHHNRKHQEKGGQEPPRPPEPEVTEPEAPYGRSLAEKQICYQVAAQGKEHTNAEQAPWCPGRIQVVRDHGKHRNGPQPVEAWHVALGTTDRLRHDALPRHQ
jgi:hypothetical protein